MRALLDTNVLVSTAIKPAGKPALIFQLAGVRFDLLTCERVLAELAEVLGRPHIQRKYKNLVTAQRREQFLAVVQSLATLVEARTKLSVASDPADNEVLAGAVDGQADFLVTGDPHLLVVKQYAGCKIVTPDQFLAVLQAQEQAD